MGSPARFGRRGIPCPLTVTIAALEPLWRAEIRRHVASVFTSLGHALGGKRQRQRAKSAVALVEPARTAGPRMVIIVLSMLEFASRS